MIYRRGRLVAAVISADAFAELERSRDERLRRTLGQRFEEVRELAGRYDYELDTGDRSDRAAGFDGT